MRFLVEFQLPIEPFNSYVRDGSAGEKIQRALESIKPEAAYFTARDGHRGGTLIVNMDDPRQLVAIAEPLFLLFEATVSYHLTISPEELATAGLDEVGKKWS